MTNNNHKNYSSADIQRYVNGQMSAEEMNAFEKAALEDPFLSDAVDGFMEAGAGNVKEGLEALQVRLQNRIKTEDKRPVFPFSTWWKIAALLIMIAGGGGLYYTLHKTSQQENTTIARNESIQPPPPLADSLSDDIISLNEPASQPNIEPPVANPPDASNRQRVPAKTSQEEITSFESKAKMPAVGKPQFPSPTLMKRNQDAQVTEPEATTEETAEVSTIITAQTSREMTNTNNFRGRVVNDSNHPVAGASVMVLNSELGLSTDTNGYFNFSFVDTTARIAISTPGYSPARATIKNNVAINEIKLHSNPQLKEEIVMRKSTSGSVSQSTPRALGANATDQSVVPVTGWKEFEKYLDKNRVVPGNLRNVHGETVLSFMVDSSGRPFQIVVEKMLNTSLDQEAIRLVREGPSWNVKNPANTKGNVTIRF